MAKRVLIIEDEQDVARLVELNLVAAGFAVHIEVDGNQGLAVASSDEWGLIVLDLALPGMDGLEICRQLRARSNSTPILMLTARSSELDRVLGLEIGADDYLTKPFSVRELVARVKAIFRRMDNLQETSAQPGAEEVFRAGDLVIDVSRRSVKRSGIAIELTAKEFDLLLQFARHPGRVYTRAELLDLVWGYAHGGYDHTVNSHINRLRSKLEARPDTPEYILTVWGVGYKFRAENGA